MLHEEHVMLSSREPLFPSWTLWMKVRAWMLIILCVLVFADREWLTEVVAFDSKPRLAIGTPEWNQAMAQFTSVRKREEELVKSKKMTVKDGVSMRRQISDLADDLGFNVYTLGVGYNARDVMDNCEQIYVLNWQPPDGWSEKDKQAARQDSYLREIRAREFFKCEWDSESEKYNQTHVRDPKSQGLTDEQVMACVRWLVRWYFLMTIPALLILLFNRKSEGESVMAELLLQPRRILLACCCGPIGVVAISDVAARALRYNRLSSKYLLERGGRPYLTDQEQAALWQMVDQPLLRFEEALESISGSKFRKPVFACLLAWLMGLCINPVTKYVSAQETVSIVSVQENSPEAKVKSTGDQPMLLAIMPAETEELVCVSGFENGIEREEAVSQVRLVESPRGPPAAVKGQQDLDSSLDCTSRKG